MNIVKVRMIINGEVYTILCTDHLREKERQNEKRKIE